MKLNLFSPKGFLQIGGLVLILIAILGYIGILGPTPDQSIFKNFWWFDDVENLAHVVLGVAALVAAFTFPAMWQRYLVMLLGAVAVLVALYNLGSPTLFGANLQNPADIVLHAVVGVWALYCVFGVKTSKK